MTYESYKEQDTFDIGKKLGESAEPGNIFLLEGDLGVGKTVFTKGFAAGLGIEEPITSPTFTIVQEYKEGKYPLYHFDVYRIGDPEEMYDIGYEEYFFGEGICIVEWPSRIEELLPDDVSKVVIEKDVDKGFDYRKIEVM